ncbi:COG3332 [Leucobacter sp. 7(1)]|uniref:NRDE family protein n=1 Tax=Leucobacter sp. 7(1) TaxID=1255613 RepID=UPI00097EAE29|nr:NRDE family protein [Leucobacter sp. 7(1)]SJN08571.1 COG3332 [Leucobacter sp. 7(1)]
MCTVVIEVPAGPNATTRVLAVRDEDPDRAWDPPGPWWPEAHPGTLGVRDRRAGGAWLAARGVAGTEVPARATGGGRLAVIVNRAADVPEAAGGFRSRGGLVLDAVASTPLPEPPLTGAFTLVNVAGGAVEVIYWDGVVRDGRSLRREPLPPGVHMIAHHEVNDPRSERITRWLPEFQSLAGLPQSEWREAWTALLARTAELGATDDRAIVRDNRPLGYPTQSLLVCLAEVSPESVTLDWAAFTEPGHFGSPEFRRA